MKKKLFVYLFFFAAGFLTHALIFPETLTNGVSDVKNLVIPNPTTSTASNNQPLITKIEFDGDRFSKHNITIGFTRYIQIINTSKTEPMELISTEKELRTPRKYAESEALQMQFNKKGQFVVADKNNQNEKLVITVK